jgi:hypothetical protein
MSAQSGRDNITEMIPRVLHSDDITDDFLDAVLLNVMEFVSSSSSR